MTVPLAYYNDHDSASCEWVRHLIAAGQVPSGTVDERPIQEVTAADLEGYHQVHLFSGILGWPLALKLAWWPLARPVLTGSPPCQPFSVAGKRQGDKDDRNLWPEMRRLVSDLRPPTIFGEQVASADGREWFAKVRDDLEALGYTVAGADLCASGVGAPHIRQRLFFGATLQGSVANVVREVLAPKQQDLFR